MFAGTITLRGLRPTRQETGFTCGPAALQCVLGFGRRRVSEAALAAAMGTTAKHGTTPAQLTKAARALHLHPRVRTGASIAWLLGTLARGYPVVVLWSSRGAHWSVAVGYHPERDAVALADPMHRRGLRLVPCARFERAWRARVAGRCYRRLGVACSPSV